MESIEIIGLTLVFVVLFAVLFIGTYKEFTAMGKEKQKTLSDFKSKEELIDFVRNLSDDEYCHYSGLPSVQYYENIDNEKSGRIS